ncbi:hypothetical protein B9Z55_003122 [Caenorhabditis nigoni]|uniref:Uncharacterized protein n=1 Tax=Caenorhabditis nigoni TaxID=1611254 RepID=A0A2G5VP36_9PELO|nr:hypothetical protein B9Z55_003122 [Caenorhabditis nigoni]
MGRKKHCSQAGEDISETSTLSHLPKGVVKLMKETGIGKLARTLNSKRRHEQVDPQYRFSSLRVNSRRGPNRSSTHVIKSGIRKDEEKVEAVRSQEAKPRHRQKFSRRLLAQSSDSRIGSHVVTITKRRKVKAKMLSGNRRALRKLRQNSNSRRIAKNAKQYLLDESTILNAEATEDVEHEDNSSSLLTEKKRRHTTVAEQTSQRRIQHSERPSNQVNIQLEEEVKQAY